VPAPPGAGIVPAGGRRLANKSRLFKKHANRRLYDTERKRYVSLDEVRELICEGVDVRVEDTRSGDDITRPILLQIMAECEQHGRPMLSPDMLMSLIRHYGHPLQDFVGPYLEESLVFYTRQEARVRKAIANLAHLDGLDGLAAMRERLSKILGGDKPD
jgi:polyhydroxyalkanoate synthesis repressor PhaR